MDAAKIPAGLPRPGDRIAGKYLIVRVIGEGGMGVVYEATHLRLRRRVALKMLLPHMLATSTDLVARFEREARAAGQLRDKHVTKVLDVDTTSEGVPYLVMEYLAGHDLEAELIKRGPLPIGEAVGYVLQICGAMAEAHAAGIVHRDLKPSNLFLTPDRDGWLVKVLDFGISKMADEGDSKLTGTQATVGTPLYMSPEQVRSSRNVDSRSDIWALGVILYELLAGRTPFEGSTTAAAAAIVADPTPPLKDFRPEVPPDLQTAIHHALSKDPKKRFGTVAEFADAITPFASVIRPSMKPATSSPTLEPASRPTPAPSTPGYLRTPDTVGTLASPFPLDPPSGTSLAPATTGGGMRPSTRWGVVAVVSVCAILAIGIGLAVASSTATKSGAASNAGDPGASMAARSPPAVTATPAQVAAAPAPSAAPSASASEAPTAHAPPVRPTPTRMPTAASPPTPRPPRSAASPSVTSPSTHGGANPLFL